jgi:DNA-binding NarL/FixJ family response regulator
MLKGGYNLRMEPNHPSTPIRLILVNPQPVVRAGLRLFLEHSTDFKIVAEAGDGEIALGLIQSLLPDVVILDINLPKINGMDIIRQIRANRWPVGTLIFTSSDDDAFINAFLKSGGNGYLLKIASAEEICTAVKEISDGKTYIDRLVLQKVITQAASPSPSIEQLSDREIEILSLVAKGLTNKVVALKLSISDRTVQGHIARIFEKLHAASRTDAVMRAIASGIIQSPETNREEYYSFEI